MSSSPFGPYRSRVVRSLQRLTRRWTERSQVALRQLQVATSWSAQVLLYPIYALFQATRLVGTQVGRAMTENPVLEIGYEADEIPLSAHPPAIAGNTPICHVLQAVQTLNLPIQLPVFIGNPTVTIRGIASQLETRRFVLVTNQNQILDLLSPQQQHSLNQRMIWEMAQYRRALRLANPSPVGRLLQAGQSVWKRLHAAATGKLMALPAADVNLPVRHSLQAVRTLLSVRDLEAIQAQVQPLTTAMALSPTSVYIQGVASQWQTRSLVLVTNRNEVLDVLTPQQQQWIQQQIVWEVAHYLRYVQMRLKADQLSPLRLPGERSQLFPGVRRLYELMAWMQTGPVAIATNLFQEAALAKYWAIAPAASNQPQLPAPELQSSSLAYLQQRLTAVLARFTPRIQSGSTVLGHDFTGDRFPEPSLTGEMVQPGRLATVSADQSAVAEFDQPRLSVAAAGRATSYEMKAAAERSLSYIDTNVQLMGYELSWLERIVYWLDYGLAWCEDAIKWVYTRLTGKTGT